MRRIGVLTSDGDYQILNTTMRGVIKSLYDVFDDTEITGLEDGYKELMYANYQITESSDSSGILTQGSIILGILHQPFKLIYIPDENGLDKAGIMKYTYKKLKLSCPVVLGRNGSQKTVNIPSEGGPNVVSFPRIIDGDLWGTDMTSGFQSTVDVVTNAIDCIHTTAAPHGRVFIAEVTGHKVGWLALYVDPAGGADIILLPGISYNANIICDALTKRSKTGKRFPILTVAKGAISGEDAKISKKELKEKEKNGVVYPSVAYEIGTKIQEIIDSEVRTATLGHMQRGSEPYAYDCMLATRLGTAAARLIVEERYGYMATVRNNDITQVPFSEVTEGSKTVNPECSTVKETKMVGISLGDE